MNAMPIGILLCCHSKYELRVFWCILKQSGRKSTVYFDCFSFINVFNRKLKFYLINISGIYNAAVKAKSRDLRILWWMTQTNKKWVHVLYNCTSRFNLSKKKQCLISEFCFSFIEFYIIFYIWEKKQILFMYVCRNIVILSASLKRVFISAFEL